MLSLRHDLYSVFFREFELCLVSTPEQYDHAAHLRHRVYSEECGYEPIKQDQRESDAYDQHSLQCLIYHRRSGLPAACIRVISANRDARLPIEHLCRDRVHLHYREKIADCRDRICEVSRFAVDPAFRDAARSSQLKGENGECYELDAIERRSFGLLSTMAVLSSLAMAEESGRDLMFCIMEPTTPRLIRRGTGVSFRQVGESFEHRGLRTPFCLVAPEAVDQLRVDVEPVYRFIQSSLFSAPRVSVLGDSVLWPAAYSAAV